MKASDFLTLVSEMRKEQKLFFATRREFAREKQEHLIASKALEKRVDQVVAEGYLEPDEPTVEAAQLGMFGDGEKKWGWNDDIAVDNELREMREEPDAGDLLDTSA